MVINFGIRLLSESEVSYPISPLSVSIDLSGSPNQVRDNRLYGVKCGAYVPSTVTAVGVIVQSPTTLPVQRIRLHSLALSFRM
jgi:hypothetical protein